MRDDEIRELFREMREEPVPADSLARVRLGAAERVAARGRRRFGWFAGAVVLATVCLVLVMFAMRERKPVPPVVARKDVAPVVVPEVVRPLPHGRGSVRGGAVSGGRVVRGGRGAVGSGPMLSGARQPASSEGAVVIRIETPDPDVVILLIGDE